MAAHVIYKTGSTVIQHRQLHQIDHNFHAPWHRTVFFLYCLPNRWCSISFSHCCLAQPFMFGKAIEFLNNITEFFTFRCSAQFGSNQHEQFTYKNFNKSINVIQESNSRVKKGKKTAAQIYINQQIIMKSILDKYLYGIEKRSQDQIR